MRKYFILLFVAGLLLSTTVVSAQERLSDNKAEVTAVKSSGIPEPIEEESNDNNNVISGSIDLVLNKFLSLRGKSYNGSKEASPILFKAQDFSTSREANPAYKSANGDYSGARYRNGGTRKGFSLALSPEQVRQNREKYSN